jgi:DNA topoisomerase-3
MNSTRAVTRRLTSRKTREVWSAGRVQTPTLSLLVNHEYRILAFEHKPYWQIQGKFQAATHAYESTWYDPKWEGNPEEGEKEDRIFDKAQAEEILKEIEGKAAQASETRKPARESAPLPFDLTSLQREANRRFSFSARRTLQAAQRLYERYKVLTYPRTDSKHLPEDYHDHVDKVLRTFSEVQPWGPHAQRLLDRGLENQKKIFDSSKVSDHFAIIPTGTVPKHLEGDDFKIFDLVTRRFLAAFHPQAVWNQVERTTQVAGQVFRVRSRTLQVPGWREAMGADEEAGDRLPPLIEGQDQSDGVSVAALGYEIQEKVTNPPSRITEARLLGMMERAGKELEDEELSEAMGEKGLGTPATRAEIIEGLISRGYVQRIRGGLKPTAKGIRLIDFLHRIDSAGLTSAELTGEWEKHLNEVEKGQMLRSDFMHGISGFTRDVVEKIKNFEYDDLYAHDPPVGVCPKHPESPVTEFFWGYRCSYNDRNGSDKEKENGKPECDFIIWKDVFGRYIDRKTASRLLAQRETPLLPGFVDQRGQEYEASLVLNDHYQVQVSGSEGGSAAEEDVVGRFGHCPCGHADCEVTETTLRYVCESLREGGPVKPKDANSCGFVLPKLVCKRELSQEEAREYLENNRTGVLEGFISKRGRPFPAILYRKENGRHGFEFLPREKKAAAKKTAKKKASKKSAKKKSAKRTTKKSVGA